MKECSMYFYYEGESIQSLVPTMQMTGTKFNRLDNGLRRFLENIKFRYLNIEGSIITNDHWDTNSDIESLMEDKNLPMDLNAMELIFVFYNNIKPVDNTKMIITHYKILIFSSWPHKRSPSRN